MAQTEVGRQPVALSARWSPKQILWGFLAIHVLIWWLLPTFLQHNLPLDVIEQVAWGREWQVVYFKHPPLPAWIVESVVAVFGRSAPALYLVGPLASALSLFAIWRLARTMQGEQRALLAVLAQEGVVYFTIFTPEFNHNVVLLPLWAALGLAGYRACFERSGWRANAWRWIWFGALAALGVLGKYTTVLLLLPMLLLAGLHPRLRRVWAGPGPWLALAVMLLLLLPHLLALWRIDFHPLLFPFERAPGPGRWFDHVVNPLLFSVAQFGDVAAALLVLGLLAWQRPREHPVSAATPALATDVRAYLWTITWAPFALAVLASLVLGVHLKDMWGYPMWCFIGLFCMAELVGPFSAAGLRRFAIAWLVILITVPAVFAAQNTFGSRFLRKATRGQFPGPELAQAMEQRWHVTEADAPLAIVVGDVWLAGNIGFYGSQRPSAFIDADPAKSPWITAAALRRYGALLIWQNPDAPPPWLNKFPTAVPQPPVELPYVPPLGHQPAMFGWAIVPPGDTYASNQRLLATRSVKHLGSIIQQ